MANIGAIVGGGFGLIRRRPGAVLAWGAIYALGTAALGYAQLRLAGTVDPTAATQWDVASLGRGLGVQIGFGLVSLILSSILSAAVFRATLWPEDRSGMASLRFGMDEVRLIGLTLILYVLGMAAGLVGGLGLTFVTTLVGFLFGGSPAMAGLFATLITMGLIGLILFLMVRLSVVYPLVLIRRRISLDASWDLTRGHFWSLLGAYVLMALATAALFFLAFLPFVGLGLRTGAYAPGGNWPLLLQQLQANHPQSLFAVIAATFVITALVSGIMLVVWGGWIASAARELLKRSEPAEAGVSDATGPEWSSR
ncbi:hypothetical protein [Sphingomonas xinjiangensis]|uniref:Glycerophosphoryl diester phosphodiesterase membrane domain-containing protein n=1 Tax=Sphingomonas xinjiangensis TaxID=643568 RepID=A0A840YHT7_9SPHN|nr:hypothetical protein [Sphingomonas xinjiangensis]MBB5711945.1 hypothetical protein [Sphingomonas xinjiangensis]